VGWDDELEGVEIGSTGLSGVGSGGAVTKVSAARQAAEQGTAVVLTATSLVSQALRGERVGTWFAPAPSTSAPSASGPSTAAAGAYGLDDESLPRGTLSTDSPDAVTSDATAS